MKHPFFSICSITVFATVAALNDTALSSSRADHFLGGFQNEFKDLMEYDSYSFDGVGMNQEVREVPLEPPHLSRIGFPRPSDPTLTSQGEKTVRVTVRGSRGSQEYEKSFTFCLVTREFGTKKGCLMTSRIVKH